MSMLIPNVEELVSAEQRYRKLLKLVDWVELARPLRVLYSDLGRRGYPVETAVKCLFLQFLEDRSDREMERYSSDPDARYGVKGKRDIWLGYKRHISVDAHQGIITAVAVTPGNVPDGRAFSMIAPSQGAVLGDKAYGDGAAQEEMGRKGLHSMAIKKQNARGKDQRKDSFLTALRMPFEGIFSKMPKRARYRGISKVHFQAVMEALVSNFKRLQGINTSPIPIS